MSETSARLLRLLSLLQTPREWPGSELAERLAVTPRTVRRDIDRLRELGYPVRATMGAQGGYRLVAGKAMPPLLLDDEEAVAIAVGLRTAARQPVAGIAEASLRALAKLQQVLPPRLGRRVAAAARLGDYAGELRPLDDASCRWRSPEDTVDWLAFRLTLLGCEFTVHEPAELVDHLRGLGAGITRAVGP